MLVPADVKSFDKGGPFPPDHLWTQPDLIGSTSAEIEAVARGEVGQERLAELSFAVNSAIRHLLHVQPQGFA